MSVSKMPGLGSIVGTYIIKTQEYGWRQHKLKFAITFSQQHQRQQKVVRMHDCSWTRGRGWCTCQIIGTRKVRVTYTNLDGVGQRMFVLGYDTPGEANSLVQGFASIGATILPPKVSSDAGSVGGLSSALSQEMVDSDQTSRSTIFPHSSFNINGQSPFKAVNRTPNSPMGMVHQVPLSNTFTPGREKSQGYVPSQLRHETPTRDIDSSSSRQNNDTNNLIGTPKVQNGLPSFTRGVTEHFPVKNNTTSSRNPMQSTVSDYGSSQIINLATPQGVSNSIYEQNNSRSSNERGSSNSNYAENMDHSGSQEAMPQSVMTTTERNFSVSVDKTEFIEGISLINENGPGAGPSADSCSESIAQSGKLTITIPQASETGDIFAESVQRALNAHISSILSKFEEAAAEATTRMISSIENSVEKATLTNLPKIIESHPPVLPDLTSSGEKSAGLDKSGLVENGPQVSTRLSNPEKHSLSGNSLSKCPQTTQNTQDVTSRCCNPSSYCISCKGNPVCPSSELLVAGSAPEVQHAVKPLLAVGKGLLEKLRGPEGAQLLRHTLFTSGSLIAEIACTIIEHAQKNSNIKSQVTSLSSSVNEENRPGQNENTSFDSTAKKRSRSNSNSSSSISLSTASDNSDAGEENEEATSSTQERKSTKEPHLSPRSTKEPSSRAGEKKPSSTPALISSRRSSNQAKKN